MRAAAFFISLLFLLTGLNHGVSAAIFPHQNQQQAAQKNSSTQFEDWQKNAAFRLGTEPRVETLLLCEEVENEDNSDHSHRKQRIQASIVLAAFYPSFAARQIYFEKPRPNFWAPSTGKYILQRTLRI